MSVLLSHVWVSAPLGIFQRGKGDYNKAFFSLRHDWSAWFKSQEVKLQKWTWMQITKSVIIASVYSSPKSKQQFVISLWS